MRRCGATGLSSHLSEHRANSVRQWWPPEKWVFCNENVTLELKKKREKLSTTLSLTPKLVLLLKQNPKLVQGGHIGTYQRVAFLAVRWAIMCQVFSKNCSYLTSNNVNSFPLWAYRIPQVNSSISPSSPTSLRAADAIIFLAPASRSPHPPPFWGPSRWICSPSIHASSAPPQTGRLICLQDASDLWYDPITDAWH